MVYLNLKKKITVIIITYNSEKSIKKVFEGIANEVKKHGWEILVIDNNSYDDTLRKVLVNKFVQVKLIKNKKNIGFAAAANQGVRIVRGEYLLFLNPDTIVRKGCIEEMVSFLKEKKDAAVVGCRVLNTDGTLQPSCGSFPTISNIILDRIPILNTLIKTELLRQKDFYNKEQAPDWISGVFFLTRRDVFLKLGGFDKQYFMYVEDVDFCYRARKAGFKIYYNPKAEIIHYDMGKSKERKKFKAKQMRIGFSIFFEKYKSPLYVFLWKTVLAAESFFKLAFR